MGRSGQRSMKYLQTLTLLSREAAHTAVELWVQHMWALPSKRKIQLIPDARNIIDEFNGLDLKKKKTSYEWGKEGCWNLVINVLVSWGWYNKLLQTGWLKITYSPTVLEARNPKSGCRQGHAVFEGSREEPFLGSSRNSPWFLVIASNPWLSLAWRCIISMSASILTWVLPGLVCFWVSPLLIRTASYGIKGPPYSCMVSL